MIGRGCLAAVVAAGTSCTVRAPGTGPFAAGAEAQQHGVTSYSVTHADARSLDVGLLGDRPARLAIRVEDLTTSQRLDRDASPPFILRTSPSRVAVSTGAREVLVMERVGSSWIDRQPLTGAERELVARLLAVDIDLAVQGSSMVFRGARYVGCTQACVAAARCAELTVCAESVVTCAGCLAQEPAP
jgi:hypothetical protein